MKAVKLLTLLLIGGLMPTAFAAPANLITNPLLRTVDPSNANLPLGWAQGGFGTNQATFSYLPTGYNGSESASVNMTQWTSGDAKWFFTPVAVTAGDQYFFSDYYVSNVPSDIMAQFNDGNGNYTYQDFGVQPANVSWTNANVTVTVPTGIQSMTIFHLISQVGWLTTSNFSLTQNTLPLVNITAPAPGGSVSGSFTLSATATAVAPATVVSVQFQIGGVNQGAAVTTPTPAGSSTYQTTWNTAGVANGPYKIVAVVTDSNGDTATSSVFATIGPLGQTCPNNSPHVDGAWRVLPYLMPINPISATLLHIGKVLIVAGSEYDSNNGSAGSDSYRAALWNPTGTDSSSVSVQNVNYDIWCSGTAVMPDGRSMIIGGTAAYNTVPGEDFGSNHASIFDPVADWFVQSQDMADGRWYATATTLGDGRIMAFSGSNSSTAATNNTVEIYDPRNPAAGWSSPVAAPFVPDLFPREFLLPNGTVFYNGQGAGWYNTTAWIMDPVTESWTASAITTLYRSYSSAVLLPLLPPSYAPRVMNYGGYIDQADPATATTEIIDLSVASPSWTPGPNMSTSRVQQNATILPNGKVLVSGGSLYDEIPDTNGKHADLFDPVAGTFGSGGNASFSRLYHSTALLLPDATIMTMGSNPTEDSYEPSIEIYTPAYLFDANDVPITTNRPAITNWLPDMITNFGPGAIGYNEPFTVTYSSTSPISAAVLVRPGSATHAFDMEQRLIGLCGPAPQPACSGSGLTLDLTTPPNGNIAPPGYYMLFLLDTAGVPSIAQFIQLTPFTTSPPVARITAPTSPMTVTAGGSVSFSGTSTNATDNYSWVFPDGFPTTSTLQGPGAITFNTPGTYGASLTTVDTTGNSDPSPPWRTITVLPATPDFSIAVSPLAAASVTPGQSATFTVTVTPLSGFHGTVNLSVDYDDDSGGVTSAVFAPSSIVGAGSATLTMQTGVTAAPYAISLTIVGVSGSLTHSTSTTLLVNLPPPSGLTATAGSTGTIALSWSPLAGATAYHLKRALRSGGPYQSVDCVPGTTYVDTGLITGTSYYYVVSDQYLSGYNGIGESADSTEATAVSGKATTTPPPGGSGQTTTASSGCNASGTASDVNVLVLMMIFFIAIRSRRRASRKIE